MKRQKFIECVLTRNSKQYLGKAYTKERVNKLNAEEVDKLFSNYEANSFTVLTGNPELKDNRSWLLG